MTNYYEHLGYSMIDHQLDPLLEVALGWIAEYGNPTPEQRAADAERIAGALEAAAVYIRAAGQPATALDLDCETCGASPGEMCWNPRTYADNKHPHHERVSAAQGIYKHELV